MRDNTTIRGRQSTSARSTLTAVLATNAGILMVLLFGANAQRPVLPLAYAGAGLALIGVFALVRSIVARRRNALPPKAG